MIFGRDLLSSLGIDTCFSDGTVKWPRMDAEIPMKSANCTIEMLYHVEDSMAIQEDVDRLSRILDTKDTKEDVCGSSKQYSFT